jgi:multiple sugar transport system permease protein
MSAAVTPSLAKPPSRTERILSVWERINRPIFYGILILWALIALAPFYFTLVFSLKPVAASYEPPLFWPSPFTLDNFRTVIQSFELFPRWLINSTIVSVTVTVLRVLFAAMAGYAFARIEFPAKNLLFSAMLISMMIPAQVTLIPKYIIIGPGLVRDLEIAGINIPTGFGLLNTLPGVMLHDLVTAFAVFMMTQFFKSLPRELEEAAMIDGLGRFGIFFRIVLPISQTHLLTLALLTFQGVWNEFLMPLVILRSPENFTLPIGLQWFQGEYYTLYSIVLAGSLFNTIPILILFFLFQRYFVQGIASTGLKDI